MKEYTKGTWVVGFGDTKELGNVYGVGLTTKPDWTVICVVSKAADVTDQDIANAHLIAAAPQLLEFAEWVLSLKTGGLVESRAREVIAKAKGE